VGICPQGNAELLAIYNDASVDWKVYRRDIEIDAPQTAGTADDEVVECTVLLPRISEPDSDIRIRKITIDCRTFHSTDPLPALAVSVSDGQNTTTAFTLGPNSTSLTGVGNVEQSHQLIFTSAPLSFTHFSDVSIVFKNIVIENVWVEYENTKEPIA
jgi:hypothetical protein